MVTLATHEVALDTHECQTVALAAHREQLVALTGLQEDQTVALNAHKGLVVMLAANEGQLMASVVHGDAVVSVVNQEIQAVALDTHEAR